MTWSSRRGNIWAARPGGLLRRRCHQQFRRAPLKNAVALVLGEDTTYERNRTGLKGELETARKLRRLAAVDGEKWYVAHSVQTDNFEIDHLVVSDRGVFVLNTKATRESGTVRVTPSAVPLCGTVGDSLPQMRRQVRDVQDTMSRLLKRPIAVAPVGVVVTVGYTLVDQGQPEGVHVTDVGDVVDWLLKQPRRLTRPQRDRLVRTLTPASAWQRNRTDSRARAVLAAGR